MMREARLAGNRGTGPPGTTTASAASAAYSRWQGRVHASAKSRGGSGVHASGGIERERGRIRSWDSAKQYGFITPHQGGNNIFFHSTSITGLTNPSPGYPVTYERVHDSRRNKDRAIGVRPL